MRTPVELLLPYTFLTCGLTAPRTILLQAMDARAELASFAPGQPRVPSVTARSGRRATSNGAAAARKVRELTGSLKDLGMAREMRQLERGMARYPETERRGILTGSFVPVGSVSGV